MTFLFIDFPILPDVASKLSWAFNGFLYFFILILFYREGTYRNTCASNIKKRVFIALVFIYCLCAFYCGDWAHLQTQLKQSVGLEYVEGFGLEKVYWYLNNFLNANYLIFRTIVWGLGLFCLFNSFKYARINPYKCLYFLFGIYITAFAYSRAGVALSIFYLGFILTYQAKEYRSKWTLIIGVCLIVASTFFHRSVLVLAGLVPLALIPVKKKYIFLIIALVVIIGFAWNTIFSYLLGSLMENEEYSHRIELYEGIAGSNTLSFNLSGFFALWYKAVVHVPFWVCVVNIYKRVDNGIIPSTIQAVFRFSIFLYGFSIMMLMTYGSASAFYYRYEGMLYIPISIMSSYLYQTNIMSRKTYIILFWICAMSLGKDFIYRIIFA